MSLCVRIDVSEAMQFFPNKNAVKYLELTNRNANKISKQVARVVKWNAYQVMSLRSMDSLIEQRDCIIILLTYSNASNSDASKNMFEAASTKIYVSSTLEDSADDPVSFCWLAWQPSKAGSTIDQREQCSFFVSKSSCGLLHLY